MRKFLYLEDSHIAQKVMCKTMTGFSKVLCATDTSEALGLLNDHVFTAFLVDYNLEGEIGFDFVKHVRNRGNYKNTPIILLSASLNNEIAYHAMRIGINCSLQKPIEPIMLKQIIVKQLKEPKIEEVSRSKIPVSCIRWQNQDKYYEYSPDLNQVISGESKEIVQNNMSKILNEYKSKPQFGEIMEIELTKYNISEPD